MNATEIFEPEFVVTVPQPLQQGVLYVSMEFATVIHLCACGCGNKVVTPLKIAGWELRYNGEGISLYPSVGCWSFPCRSHYLIRQNRVIWSNDWSDEEIRYGREETIRLNLEHEKKAKTQRQARGESTTQSASNELQTVKNEPSKSRFARLLGHLMIWR